MPFINSRRHISGLRLRSLRPRKCHPLQDNDGEYVDGDGGMTYLEHDRDVGKYANGNGGIANQEYDRDDGEYVDEDGRMA